MKLRNLLFGLAALGLGATPALANQHMAKAIKTNTSLSILTSAKGLSLYVFDKDQSGASSCNGGCAKNWPPLMATAKSSAEGSFSIISRADGSKQWAHQGKALYRWIGDKKAGDVTGDGVGGVWHLARP